jgi:hypothetical protein
LSAPGFCPHLLLLKISSALTALQDYEQKSIQLEKLKERRSDKDKRHLNCTCFIDRLDKFEENDISFNEKLWISLVDYSIVPGDGEKALTFHCEER